VHFPVKNREGDAVTSAITNVDVHDLARSARTFGLAGYWVVSPIAAQRLLVERILDHWKTGAGARRVPERAEALARCRPIASVDDAMAAIAEAHGARPELWITAARVPAGKSPTTYEQARARLAGQGPPVLILFGTAHGLHPTLTDRADVVLPPIDGGAGYNHLSVRAAAAITLDRLRASTGVLAP
jgi:hypothetical protein